MIVFLKRLFNRVDPQEQERLFWLNYIPSHDKDSDEYYFYSGIECARRLNAQEKEIIKELISQGKTNVSWSQGFCLIEKGCGPVKKECVRYHSLSKGDRVQVEWTRISKDGQLALENVSEKGYITEQVSPTEHEILFDDGTVKMFTQPIFTITRIEP